MMEGGYVDLMVQLMDFHKTEQEDIHLACNLVFFDADEDDGILDGNTDESILMTTDGIT